MSKDEKRGVSRRSFVKGSTLTALAAMAGSGVASMYGCSSQSGEKTTEQAAPEEKVIWNACSGCGVCLCPLQFHVVDGTITYVEGDTTGDSEFGGIESRACLRGRSIRRLINHPDRITHPMKRVEKRGSGDFEQISWDEALDLFYEKLKYAIDTYGNEAIYKNGSAGSAWLGGHFARLMNMMGGFLSSYGTDSQTQADFGAGYTLAGQYSSGIAYMAASHSTVALDADLIVMFGSSAATSRIGGGNCMHDFAQAREKGARIIWIDVRQGEESSGHPDEWLPIRPGTDAALASALCYVFINEGIADGEFLHTHVVGYDEETMPESAKGQNKSYKDYIMGTGYDMVAKTPEWASPITGIPVDRIYELARDIGNAKAAYIGNGVGVQRRVNGENGARAVMMIPLISGQWGLPGTSTGLKPACSTNGPYLPGYQTPDNPVKAIVPCTMRIDVIERGEEMTALRDGLWGAEKLTKNVKFMYSCATNMLANQNPDVNWSTSVLEDENKCEFIVGSDWFMTSSMRYCDLILPERMPQEGLNLANGMSGGAFDSFIFGQQVQETPGECRSEFDWLADIAERFGIRDQFTEGTNPDEKAIEGYKMVAGSEAWPDLPPYEEGVEKGFWVRPTVNEPKYVAFREDPEANPLPTPSGKVEIYSEGLAQVAETWELDDPRDIISSIPMYVPDFEGFEEATKQYPLQVSSWKSKIRYHSKFDQIEVLRQANRHVVWINPLDAEARGIETGDMVRVFNDRGELRVEARVTPRIIPGAVAMEEGRNRELDENGIDVGGCINTLVSHHWAPLSKFNPSNSILAQVEKL